MSELILDIEDVKDLTVQLRNLLMFFKQLQLFGFKSFAQKTKLDFNADVTAIVGPNGCGKSNLVDGIKWVLGEQSVRSLRGTTMEDVIFHGADGIPAVGFAEVSLTISNQDKLLPLDYEELTITRRIFRSGESEYLLNKVPVRLKDISELLMGTGVGMSSYSLMEQGQVDQILSSRPEERRSIFEEAAGITKYKSKKEEALRKLERTGENLQRIGDIIVEVKRQITSMERQVNKARRYKEEFEKLKEYELKVSEYEYQTLKKEKRDLEHKIAEQEKEELSLNAQMSSVNDTLEKAKQELFSVEQGIASVQEENYQLSATIKTAQEKIFLDEERIEELIARQKILDEEIQVLAKKLAATVEQITDAQKQIEDVEQKKQENVSLLAEKEERINDIVDAVKEAQEKVASDKMQEVEVIAQQARLKNNLTKLQADMANLNSRMRRLNVESERTSEELNNMEERHSLVVNEYGSLSEQLKLLKRKLWDFKSNLDVELKKKQQLETRLEGILAQMSSRQSNLSFLREITKNYEGFSKGVKSVLSAIESRQLKIQGFCGLLADLIKVLPQYQLAIEMALQESIQAIIVETKEAARAAIDYLKAQDLGRAKFICLDSLRSLNVKDTNLKGSLTKARDIVQVEEKYRKLLDLFLANTFIVQDLEIGMGLLAHLDPQGKLVTLNGEVLTKTAIVAGSSPGDLEVSLLGRRERIAQIELELEKLQQEKVEVDGLRLTHDEQVNQILKVIGEHEPSVEEMKIKLANKESERANIEQDTKRFQDELAVVKIEIDETDEQMQQLKSEEENLTQELEKINQRHRQLHENLQSNQQFIAESNQEKHNLLVEVAQIKTQRLNLDREAEDSQKRLALIKESQAETTTAQEARGREKNEALTKIEQLKQEIANLERQSEELAQTKLSVEEKMKQSNQKRQSLSAGIHDLDTRLKNHQKELDSAREKRSSLQIRRTELNYKQGSLEERMQQNYQVDLPATLADAQEVSPPEDFVFAEINRLKSRLEGIGPVNLVAIEENDQLQQRYSFLISQQEDLINAQESLRKAIHQINHTARAKFSETFEQVQVSFKEYFRILFGGGDIRLILLDENNVLESGIEIVVRPPGKKLQNISLLSGGEKALTAIALLFAIFKVKPSPFCILDEVDAALDEANIDRFTNLLSEFIKTSQFIIITHNKRTINMAEIMYGITMEKTGVSKIVSVRFTDERPAAAQEEIVQVEK